MSTQQAAERAAAWQALRSGSLQQAAALAGALVARDERDHDALHLLGLIAHMGGQPAMAERMLERAIAISPDLADYHNNLATVRVSQGRREAAIEPYRRAADLPGPSAAEARFNLALTLLQCDRPAEALEEIKVLASQGPLSAKALDAQGSCFYLLGRFDEAVHAARQAVVVAPDCAAYPFNLGNALGACQDRQGAEAAYLTALALEPGYAEAHVALAGVRLATGRLAEGWPDLDWHWRQPMSFQGIRPFPQREWKGEDLAGKTLLVWMEQGLGDEIEYANMLGDAIARARHVVIECEIRLATIFSRSFPEAEVVARQRPLPARLLQADIDYQINAGSMLPFLRPTLADFPQSGGFLRAEPGAVAHWRARLASLGAGRRVGFSWRSKLQTRMRSFHYSSLDDWGALFALPGIVWVNLQYDQCEDELKETEARFGVTVHRFPELDLMNDLEGAAALTAALDLVISPANSVTMMAGALGVPTWMALFDAQNWHRLGTSGHAFLPSVRVFPRVLPDTWGDVFARMAGALAVLQPDS